jgi:hypothetical protein
LLLAPPGAARAQDTAIGTWLLVCPTKGACVLRHARAQLDVAGVTIALEVRSIRGALVPVVALSGLSGQATLIAGLAVALRLDHGAWTEMPCAGLSVCAPADGALATVAKAFPVARTMGLRMTLSLPGVTGLPRPDVSFALSGTAEALRRLRAGGVAEEAAPAEPGLDWRGMIGKLLGG